MSLGAALAWALALMGLAVVFAHYVERHETRLSRWLAHPLTYTLSLSAYFTGWAYFGTGTALFSSGLSYLSHEIGWSFLFLFGWPLVLRAARFARAQRVTTLPGFMAVRYGASGGLTALVVGILVVAMLPYMAVQLQAIAFAIGTVTHAQAPDGEWLGRFVPMWAVLVAGFAILFGGRQADPTCRHPGVVATLAVSGAFKLVVLVGVAIAAWWRLGPEMAALSPSSWPTTRLGSTVETSYLAWLVNMGISMAGVLILPHMFQLAVVEGRTDRQVQTSRWAFPLYGWVFEVAVLPITIAGVVLGLSGQALQGAVLLVPQHDALRLAAFLGGVAAATGMAIVTLIALANMLLLDVVLPIFGHRVARIARWLVPMRAGLIAGMALAATGLWRFVEHRFLFELGLVAFVAVTQVAPGFFGGLVWPHLRGRAVAWGLGLSSAVWLYTAMLPALAPGVPAIAAWVASGPGGLGWLRPHALFGVEGLSPTVHAFLWCSLANLAGVWAVMARHPASAAEVVRARTLLAGEAAPHTAQPLANAVDWGQLEALAAAFLGPERAREELARMRDEATGGSPETRVLAVRDDLERVLRGPLGPMVAEELVSRAIPMTEQAMVEVMQAYRQLEQLLQLSQEELADRIQELTRLKDELEARVAERTGALAAERDRLSAAIEDLRNLERLKTAFVNAISHDLRIPLTGIMGYAEFLEDEIAGPITDDQRDFVANILDASRRMTRLLNELLDFARLEAGKFTVEARPMELADAVAQAGATFYPTFERKAQRYTVEMPDDLPEVHADPERVVQVLSNLLSNAAKFTPEGGAVTVRATLDDDAVRVEVSDTGVGIAPEDMEHLFERFYQTQAGQAAGGTGLGLSISRTLIEAQGGHMGVVSHPGQGSTFWFTLPLAGDDEDL